MSLCVIRWRLPALINAPSNLLPNTLCPADNLLPPAAKYAQLCAAPLPSLTALVSPPARLERGCRPDPSSRQHSAAEPQGNCSTDLEVGTWWRSGEFTSPYGGVKPTLRQTAPLPGAGSAARQRATGVPPVHRHGQDGHRTRAGSKLPAEKAAVRRGGPHSKASLRGPAMRPFAWAYFSALALSLAIGIPLPL